MYQCNTYRVKVSIYLENGLYAFVSTSSTGKTYLYKVLRQMNADGENVLGYAYDDEVWSADLGSILKRNNYSVVMVDRYDLFKEKYIDILREYSKNAIVLLDCKSEVLDDVEPCDILLSINKIEVI